MRFELDDNIAALFPANANLFDEMMRLSGESFRQLEGRTTARVVLGGKTYFIKQHRGIGWREIFKNLSQGRLPITGARHEWLALKHLAALGVSVPRVFGFGERGWNPATRESFILMEALEPTVSLETYCQDWAKQAPAFLEKQNLIAKVANIARTLHNNGMNHRDFYICHFLRNNAGELSLIDLHRAGIRSTTPERWVIKDLAGLYFSSKNLGLTQRDYFRFMKVYRQEALRVILQREKPFWDKVKNLGEKLYRDHQ